MPISTLNPTCALLVIDLQNGVMGAPFAHRIASVVDRTRTLLDGFCASGRPVVLVNADGVPPGRTDAPRIDLDFPEGWADLIPELDAGPDDIRVTKQTWGAFHGTGLADRLKAIGVTQVVITGVATGMGGRIDCSRGACPWLRCGAGSRCDDRPRRAPA